MPNYLNGRIYRVFCEDGEPCDEYIGSTVRTLSQRMAKHRSDYKNGLKYTSCILFKKYGVENCKIELIEDYPCERREQLEKREGEIQRQRACVNKQIAGRTKKQYRQDNKAKIVEKHKIYNEKNKQQIAAKEKIYREQNKDKIAARKKIYYQNNREKILERQKEYNLKKKQATLENIDII
jgi:hypothetical protein